MINILIANAYDLYRLGIKKAIQDITGINILGEVNCAQDAIRWCRSRLPDVVIMDVEYPLLKGLDATKKITHYSPEVSVILLTDDYSFISPAKILSLGAKGYLYKSASKDDLAHAIRVVKSGQRYISPQIAQFAVLNQFDMIKNSSLDKLSAKERQIMVMIAQGNKVTHIAKELCLSTKTINSYRYRIFSKLNIRGDIDLVHLAIRHGLIYIETV